MAIENAFHGNRITLKKIHMTIDEHIISFAFTTVFLLLTAEDDCISMKMVKENSLSSFCSISELYYFMFSVLYCSLNTNWVWELQCQTHACHHCGRVKILQFACGMVVVTLPRYVVFPLSSGFLHYARCGKKRAANK